jgi:arginine exporter protein ArgO
MKIKVKPAPKINGQAVKAAVTYETSRHPQKIHTLSRTFKEPGVILTSVVLLTRIASALSISHRGIYFLYTTVSSSVIMYFKVQIITE